MAAAENVVPSVDTANPVGGVMTTLLVRLDPVMVNVWAEEAVPTVVLKPERVVGLRVRFGAFGSVTVPLTVIFERPATSESIDSIRVRRFEFMPGDGPRIVWPDEEPAAGGKTQDAARPGP